jgi:ubiquinone/menaquinone biosynthesis C-methylase UbiE
VNSVLLGETSKEGTDLERNHLSYLENMSRILKPGGFFIIISCNHDEAEMTHLFENIGGFKLLKNLSDMLSDQDLCMMLYQKSVE